MKARTPHPSSKPKWKGGAVMPTVPKGWREKLQYAAKAGIGSVFTADEIRELALVTGVREAGRR